MIDKVSERTLSSQSTVLRPKKARKSPKKHLGQSPKPTQLGIISGAVNGPNMVCSLYRPNSVIWRFPIEISRSTLAAEIDQN